MNKQKTDNLSTQPKQHFEAGTNTNLGSNTFSQTQPIRQFEASTNTNLPSNRFSQTQEGKVNTQSTNIPSQNQISTHNDSCKCEDDDEMDHTGIQYRSNFARQLQQSEVIPKYYTQQPGSNYISHTEKPNISQAKSSTIYHICLLYTSPSPRDRG